MPDDRNPDLNRNADIEYNREQVGRHPEEDMVDSSDEEFEDVDELDDEQEEIEER